MKPCPHCGKELPQEMQFCPYCMEKLITETVIGDTPVRRRRQWWLWLVVLLLLLVLVCGLWLWRPWQPPSAKEKVAASVSSRTTTTAATSAAPTASKTASNHQTASNATSTATKHPSTTHTTGVTSTPSRATTTSAASGVTSTTTRGSSTGTTADPCGAGHDWEDIAQTVHVDEVGHYETKTVGKQVTLFRCALCYKEFDVLEDYYDHFDSQHDGDSLEVVFRDRYETFEEYREVEVQTWVVDTPAHDETITVGRHCRVCGKTETYQDKE